ncbi:MAG: hypothetical protein KDK24_06615 [Pseudooceanicola sp.]|nr:hypothetical protein [Pseudooceanicola sp.]
MNALIHARLLRDMRWRSRIAIVLFAFPVLCFLAAGGLALEVLAYISRSEPLTGTAVQVYARPGETIFDRGRINYEPVFTYTQDGEERRASVGSGHTAFRMEVGDTAPIRAIPGDRGNVRLDTFQGLWFVPVTIALFGLASLVVLLPLWWAANRFLFRKGQA